jgi:hypothetical protein
MSESHSFKFQRLFSLLFGICYLFSNGIPRVFVCIRIGHFCMTGSSRLYSFKPGHSPL